MKPKHSKVDRTEYSYVGNINHSGYFVASGSVSGLSGSTTGSFTVTLDALGATLKRVQVFHSGASTGFHINIENKSVNTGSMYDPRATIVEYLSIPGGDDFRCGIDQIESLPMMTDQSVGSEGKVYINLMPFDIGCNWFKYLLFFEAAFIYVRADGSINND